MAIQLPETDFRSDCFLSLQNFTDSQSHVYALNYSVAGRLIQINEPAGRYLKVNYQTLSVKQGKVTVISSVQSSDGRSVTYGYQEMADVISPSTLSYQVLSTVSYGDNTQAQYGYAQMFTSDPPLLTTIIDPRYPNPFAQIRNEYDTSATNQIGRILHQYNYNTGAIVFSLNTLDDMHHQAIDSRGMVHTVTTTTKGLVKNKVDGNNSTNNFSYNTNGVYFLESHQDPLGRMVSRTTTPFNNNLSRTLSDDSQQVWTRDSLDLPLSYANERGHTTAYTRDTQHRITRIDYPDSAHETFSYNSFGEVLTHQLRNSKTESNVYDSRGLKTSYTDTLGNVTSYGYDSADRLASVTDARGNTTQMQSNERGLLTQMINPDGSFRSYTYDSFGNRTSETNELGKVWTHTFDDFKRLTSMTDPLNRTTTYSYTLPNGTGGDSYYQAKPAKIISPEGKVHSFVYDAEWRLTSETVGDGTSEAATTQYQYDSAGNRTVVVDPKGGTWSFSYDSRDRMVSSTDPLGNQTQWSYDEVGNVLTVTRPDGGVTTNVYDSMNRLTQTTDPKGQVTRMAYDASNNLISTTDAKGNVYGFEYDDLNRRTAMVYPDGSRESYGFDAVGNMVSYTTRADQVKTVIYDNRNRETSSSWSDGVTPAVAMSYDTAGRLLTMQSPVSSLGYSYDDANELLSETQDVSGAGGAKTVSYTWNADGNRGTMTYPDGLVLNYGYTGRNQLSSIQATGSSSPLGAYSFDLNGNRIGKTLENGTSVSYGFDSANRVTNMVHQAGLTSFASFTQDYDSVNRRKYVKREDGKGDVFSYDSVDQVTNVKYDAQNSDSIPLSPVRVVDYLLDAVGNRTSVTDNGVSTSYLVNILNEYSQVGSEIPSYDSNGNLISYKGWSYSYDAQNRLLSASNGSTSVTFAYDARNRCVKRVINGTSTFFYFDNWDLVEERDAADAEIAHYVRGAMIDEILTKVTTAGAIYYQHDSLGNVTQLTDSTGTVVEKYSYDIFGAPTILAPDSSILTSSAYSNRFMFTGREFIQEIGLYDYRNRMYSPEWGRFLQTDPLRFGGDDVNLYRYVSNNPVNEVDPWGLKWVSTGKVNPSKNTIVAGKDGTIKTQYSNQNPKGTSQDVLTGIDKHEQSHAKDALDQNKDVAKGVKEGTIIGNDNPKELAESEVKATQIEIDYLKSLNKPNDPEIAARIKQLEDYLQKNKAKCK